jgi:chromosome segregation ATPase
MVCPFKRIKFADLNSKCMYKTLLLLSLVTVIEMEARSQSFTTKVEYQKTQRSAAAIQLPYGPGTVEDAIKEYMAKRGYKSASSKGFDVFRAARLDSSDTELSDLYFKIERKSRQEKDMTLIALLPTKKNIDILLDTLESDAKIGKARSFLDNLTPYIDAYHVQLQVNDQAGVVKKAEKKMNGLLSDQNSLNKKIRKLQEDSAQNKKDQVKAAADIQANINADDDTRKKSQKKMRKLLDDEGDLAKRLRNTQADLDQNKRDQDAQQQEIDKQKQTLGAIKAKQKS